MEVLSVNQHPIVSVKMSGFFYIKGALFLVDTFEDVIDVVVHCRYSV